MRNHLRCLSALWVIQLAIVVYFALGVEDSPGVPFDDAWIHFAIARNIADYGQVSFNVGVWSGGTTSLLWDILLALGYRIGADMLAAAWVLGALAYIAVGTAFYSLLVPISGSLSLGHWLACLVALALCATAFIPYLALSGMDTHLFLALGLGSLAAFVHRRYQLVRWLLAALMLTRIEGIGLLPILVGAAVLKRDVRGERRKVWVWLFPALLALLAYLGFNLAVTGHPLPTTMAGRRWLWGFPESSLAFSASRLEQYARDWLSLMLNFVFIGKSGPCLWGIAVVALLGLGHLLRSIVRHRWLSLLGSLLVLGWITGHNLMYVLVAPIASWRHQIVNVLVLPLLLMWGGNALLQKARGRFEYVVMAGLFAMVVGSYLPGLIAYRRVFVGNVQHINAVHVRAGQWLATNVPETATVAAFDIGAVKFFGEQTVLDLGGLVESRFVTDYLYAGRVPDYLKEHRASYLVMPEPAAAGQTDLRDRLGITQNGQPTAGSEMAYEALASFEIDPYISWPYEALTYQFYPAYRKVTVYAITLQP